MTYLPDWTPSALQKWVLMADRLGADPLDLGAVSMSESGLHSWAHNPGGADGLIQFTSLRSLGWTDTPEAFRALSPEAQLPFVERYWRPYKGLLASAMLAYTATFLPAELEAVVRCGGDYVLCARGGKLGWAYEANAVFDADHDLKIEARELQEAIDRNCRGARWEEWAARIRQVAGLPTGAPKPLMPAFDLRTTLGIQEALAELGWSPGPVDGVPGPLTRAALVGFQRWHSLAPDGIPGPLTRAKLAEELDPGPITAKQAA